MENWKWNQLCEEKKRIKTVAFQIILLLNSRIKMKWTCVIFEIKWQIGKQHLYIRSHLLRWQLRINIEKGTSQSTIIHWHQSLHTIYYIEINDRWRCARKMDTHIVSKQASQRLYFGKKNWKISAIYCRYESDYEAMMTDGLTSFYD